MRTSLIAWLPATAFAAGGSYPGMPDRFWDAIGLIAFIGLVVYLFRKL